MCRRTFVAPPQKRLCDGPFTCQTWSVCIETPPNGSWFSAVLYRDGRVLKSLPGLRKTAAIAAAKTLATEVGLELCSL